MIEQLHQIGYSCQKENWLSTLLMSYIFDIIKQQINKSKNKGKKNTADNRKRGNKGEINMTFSISV